MYGESRDRDSEEPSRSDNLDTRYVYTCVGAECGRGRKSEYDKQHQLKRNIEVQQSEIELEIPKTYT